MFGSLEDIVNLTVESPIQGPIRRACAISEALPNSYTQFAGMENLRDIIHFFFFLLSSGGNSSTLGQVQWKVSLNW